MELATDFDLEFSHGRLKIDRTDIADRILGMTTDEKI